MSYDPLAVATFGHYTLGTVTVQTIVVSSIDGMIVQADPVLESVVLTLPNLTALCIPTVFDLSGAVTTPLIGITLDTGEEMEGEL